MPFALADAQELIAIELGFGSWKALRLGGEETQSPQEKVKGDESQLLGAFPQLFVGNVDASCKFFVETLGFTVSFKYGQPAFYALIQRDHASLNLRFVHKPVLLQDAGTDNPAERDLLAASVPVENIKALYVEYKAAGAPM